MADAVAIVLLAITVTAYIGLWWGCVEIVKLLYVEGKIQTHKTKARWLLLCIVWPIIPVIGVFWIVGVIVFWLWRSFANLLHDAQLGKRN